jgi:uncharacterized coiled-coil protein SlyX
MLKELKRLPFEERNEQDFEDLTRKIWDAIATVKKSRSIPATQEKLAELVGCTRKTLHNRGWPITELKKIKKERKANSDSKPKNITAEHRLSSENHIAREKLLIGQIRNLQEQNGKLFNQVQELEEQKAISNDTIKVLEDEILALKDVIRKLEAEMRKLKQERNGRNNVVSIRSIKKTKGASKGGK